MKIEIKTASEQWKTYLDTFIESGMKVEAVENASYSEKVFIETAKRYIKQFDLPIRVTVFCGVIRFERTDM